MKRYTRILAVAAAVSLGTALAPMPTASADVAPVKRVSCPSVAEINALRPAASSEAILWSLASTPTTCVYRVQGPPADPPVLTFEFSDLSTPNQVAVNIQAYYDANPPSLFLPQALPALGTGAFAWADASNLTDVYWELSAGAVADMKLVGLTWLANAKVPVAQLFHPLMEVYTIVGERTVNDRQWRTTCENYSATARCRTEIFATTVERTGKGYRTVKDWAFNSLTYRWSNRALWGNNPLGNTGTWTSAEGRKWRTECDTPNTGNGACRSYIWTTVIALTGGKYTQSNMWVFNNQVLFSD